MTAMKSKQPANSEHRSNDLSTVQEQSEYGLNPKKSLPYKFTVGISLGVFAILLVYTAYYYGFFR
jgi:hypothetical protein